MKKLMVLVAILFLKLSFVVAQSSEPISSEALKHRMEVTRGFIKNIRHKLEISKAKSRYSNADYLDKEQQFYREYDKSLTNFEDALQEKVFSKADTLVKQYNAMKVSEQYSQTYKESLLNQLKSSISNQFKKLSLVYQDEIRKVTLVLLQNKGIFDLPAKTREDMSFQYFSVHPQIKPLVEMSSGDAKSRNEFYNYGIYKCLFLDQWGFGERDMYFFLRERNDSRLDAIDYDRSLYYGSLFLKAEQKCFSQSCMVLSSALLLEWVKSFEEKINVEIKVDEFTLTNNQGLSQVFQYAHKVFSGVNFIDLHPELPFDIDEETVRPMIEAQEKAISETEGKITEEEKRYSDAINYILQRKLLIFDSFDKIYNTYNFDRDYIYEIVEKSSVWEQKNLIWNHLDSELINLAKYCENHKFYEEEFKVYVKNYFSEVAKDTCKIYTKINPKTCEFSVFQKITDWIRNNRKKFRLRKQQKAAYDVAEKIYKGGI